MGLSFDFYEYVFRVFFASLPDPRRDEIIDTARQERKVREIKQPRRNLLC